MQPCRDELPDHRHGALGRIGDHRMPAIGKPLELHEMRRQGAARGAATMCIGVGQGIASLWEAA